MTFIPILAYHKIQKTFDFSVTYITPGKFEAQLKYLVDLGYESISLHDYISKKNIYGKKVIFTFDDAYASVFEYAFPLLTKYNFKASIFVITQFVGKPNRWDYNFLKKGLGHCNWQQINTLASKGWEVGSHTVSHPNLKALSDSQVRYEVNTSKSILEDKLQKPINIISYPFGKYNERVLETVKEAGYLCGCTLGYNYPHDQNFPFAIFRRGVYLAEPFKLFQLKLQNSRLSHLDDVKQKFITFCSQGSILLRYFKSI